MSTIRSTVRFTVGLKWRCRTLSAWQNPAAVESITGNLRSICDLERENDSAHAFEARRLASINGMA